MVQYVKTKAEFDALLTQNEAVIVDFTASWCGPCKKIAPFFEGLAEKYPNIKLVKVDVDENNETAEAQGISAMPTFKAFHHGKKVKEVTGASEKQISEMAQALSDLVNKKDEAQVATK